MQKEFNWSIVSSILIAAMLLISFFGWFSPETPVFPTAAEIAALVTVNTPTVDFPTAAEIAAEIDISESTSSRGYSGNLNQDIIQGIYKEDVKDLEEDCTKDLQEEFSVNDRLDDIQDLIEDSIGEYITDLKVITYDYKNEYDFIVTDLGLRNDEDRAARITSTIRVSYELEDGEVGVVILDKVYAEAACSDWDINAAEFDDLTVEYSLNDRY